MKTKRGYNTRRVYAVRCDSGIMGWRTRLQNNYKNFEDWLFNSECWGLLDRLNRPKEYFADEREAWEANPIIQGSVNWSDFRCL